jgi:hypothetical protein
MIKDILHDVKRKVHLDRFIPHFGQPRANIGNIAKLAIKHQWPTW